MKALFKPGVLVAVLTLLLALGSMQTAMAQVVRTPSPEGATVRISNIEDGAELPTTFVVKFEVTGMEVVPAGQNTPNSGHHHLLIDVNEIASASQPLPATDKIIHYGKGDTEAEITLPPGRHTLQLMFADYRHILFDPVVMSEQIDITVLDDSKKEQKK